MEDVKNPEGEDGQLKIAFLTDFEMKLFFKNYQQRDRGVTVSLGSSLIWFQKKGGTTTFGKNE